MRPSKGGRTNFSSVMAPAKEELEAGIVAYLACCERQQTAARGHIAHYCDNSFAYGMLVKAGLGIGLLGSYSLVEPSAVDGRAIDHRPGVPETSERRLPARCKQYRKWR